MAIKRLKESPLASALVSREQHRNFFLGVFLAQHKAARCADAVSECAS